MPLYQLTLFYPNLKEHSGAVRDVRAEIESIAGKNWRVLSAGEQVCAIGFVSDLEHKQLASRFLRYGSENFLFVLTQASAVVGGYLHQDALQWLSSRLPGK